MKKLRVAVTGSAGVVIIAVAVLATLGYGGSGKGNAAPPPAPPSTSPVTRTTLVDQVHIGGTVGYGTAASLSGRVEGTVTMVAAPGTILGRNSVAFRVDDQPVVVMLGDLPAYRTLAEGVSGPDVTEFEQNLAALGYHGFKIGTTFDKSITAVVKQWQKKLGLPDTGTVDLGRVVYEHAAIRVAEQKQQPGDAAAPGSPVLTYTGITRLVSAQLDQTQAGLAKVGTAVQVQSATGKSAAGTVTSAQSGGDAAQGKTTITMSVTDQSVLGNGGDTVDVVVVLGETKDVLTVPIVALLAVGGGYAVQVYSAGTGGQRLVPVTLGMFGQGRVQVSGPGLTEGMQVVVANG